MKKVKYIFISVVIFSFVVLVLMFLESKKKIAKSDEPTTEVYGEYEGEWIVDEIIDSDTLFIITAHNTEYPDLGIQFLQKDKPNYSVNDTVPIF